MKYDLLFSPVKIAGLTLKNRIFSAPTSLAELSPEGFLTPDNICYYKLRAAGGCAVVTVGESIVNSRTGQSHPRQIPLDNPDVIPSLVETADAIHAHGAAASIELSHGGGLCEPRYVENGLPVGPSDFLHAWGDRVYGMSEAQIESHAEDFGRAAARVKDCGFDMLVIHGGHGWLLHQFLSPLTNKRNDAFGGSLENRMRFPLMVADRVREAVGADFPVEFRMSADERMEGGYGAETGIGIALLLDGRVDLIHVSAGSNMDMYSAALMHPGCFQSHGENGVYAARIKRRVRTPVISVGAFSEPDKMESFLAEGHADCLALGRALIADPFLPKKALLGRTEDITPCLRCGECQGGMFATRTMRCSVNPVIGSERAYFSPPPAPARRKKVLVAGGGPAGLSAAIAAAERGHEVILCEARPALGGALKFADFLEFKGNVRRFREHLISRARRLRVDIRLGTRADAALVEKEKPDALIAACGALPVVPPIPGICGANVLRASSLERDTPVGRRVVVIGGGLIGCETALQLAGGDHDVQIIEMKPEAAEDCAPFHRVNLLRQMEKAARLSLSTGLRCLSVDGKGVYARDAEGEERFFPVDTVILAAGMKADEDELERLRPLVPLFYAVGDARRARKIMHAVRDGTNAAVDLGLPLS